MALNLILRRGLLATAPLLLLTAACSGEDVAENILEEAIENETDGDVEIDDDGSITVETEEGTVSIDVDEDGGTINIEGEGEDGEQTISVDSDEDGTVTVETDDGSTTMSGEIPDGFPTDVFTVPTDAANLYGIIAETSEGRTYNLSFQVDQGPEEFWNEIRGSVPSSATITTESSGSTGGAFAAQMVFEGWDGWAGLVTINTVDGEAGVNYLLQPSG
ncbi:MAG: hypothetical protein GY745_14620 [Actinomycetia bacterium]|nr:hypothetical protein [Actinomycetes bacterium]MCP4086269.1 hypothetical protein [Actinomycetes bacterium]